MARKRRTPLDYPDHTYQLAPPDWAAGSFHGCEMRVNKAATDEPQKAEFIDACWKNLTTRDHVASAR